MKKAQNLLIAIISLSLVFSVFTITAFASSTGSINTSDDELATIAQLKENDANKKYNIMLAHWAYDKEFPDDVYANFPSFYGGAYIDSDKNLVIQITNTDASTITYFKNLIELNNVIFEEVAVPFSALVAAKDAAASKMVETNNQNNDVITAIGISIPKNAVNFYVNMPNVEKYNIDINKICKSMSSIDNVNIIESAGKNEPCASAPCPGDYIDVNGSGRSIGFWAYNSSNQLGIVTAPHSQISSGETAYINSTTFGIASTPYYGGNVDAVFVRRTNSNFVPTRYIPGHESFYASGTYRTLAVGATVYSRGCSSGAQTGAVEDIAYTCVYNDITLYNCALTSASCLTGDSGGIVVGMGNINTRYLVGIVTGRRTSDGYLIYTKAHYILSSLGCTVY